MTLQFRRATRAKVRLKLLLTGPSGSGKTLGALHIADGIAPGKIALIDSEHDRSGYYADRIAFDSLSLERHQPKDYIAALNAAVAAGYEVVVIDSLSHAWEDILDRKELFDKANPKSNSWTNWKTFSKEWDTLTRAILEAPVHVIATGRSKMAHEQQIGGDGKKTVVKLGLAPVLRDSTEYDYALSFAIESTHAAFSSKDNTGLFGGENVFWDLTDGQVPALLRSWLESAVEVERPLPETSHAIDDALLELPEQQQVKARQRIAAMRSAGLSEEKAQTLLTQLRGMIEKGPSGGAPPESTAPTTPPDASAAEPADAAPATAEPAPEPVSAPSLSRDLSAAAATKVRLRSGEVVLGECDIEVLSEIRRLAVKHERTTLLAAVNLVIEDRLATEAASTDPPRDGTPDADVPGDDATPDLSHDARRVEDAAA